jgi:hypothetical protein
VPSSDCPTYKTLPTYTLSPTYAYVYEACSRYEHKRPRRARCAAMNPFSTGVGILDPFAGSSHMPSGAHLSWPSGVLSCNPTGIRASFFIHAHPPLRGSLPTPWDDLERCTHDPPPGGVGLRRLGTCHSCHSSPPRGRRWSSPWDVGGLEGVCLRAKGIPCPPPLSTPNTPLPGEFFSEKFSAKI